MMLIVLWNKVRGQCIAGTARENCEGDWGIAKTISPSLDPHSYLKQVTDVINALCAELEATGAHFRTTSDTETLLHLYARYGVMMVHRLSGMFAFARELRVSSLSEPFVDMNIEPDGRQA